MSNNESDVEKHLRKLVVEKGGLVRKWVSPHHVGVPDDIVINTITVGEMIDQLKQRDPGEVFADISFVEVKTHIGKLSSMQEREAVRLRAHGAKVHVVYGRKGVELFVDEFIQTT